MQRQRQIIRSTKTGRITGLKFELIPVDVEEDFQMTGWKFRFWHRGEWQHRYFKENEFRPFLRKYMEHVNIGIDAEVALQFEGKWVYVQEDITEWLLSVESRGGRPREYWKEIIDQVQDVVELHPSRPVTKWRTKLWRDWSRISTDMKTTWKWGHSRQYTSEFEALRAYFRTLNKLEKEMKEEPDTLLVLEIQQGEDAAYHRIAENRSFTTLFVEGPEEVFGQPREYWTNLVEEIKNLLYIKPVFLKNPNLDPYEDDESASEEMTFTLADLPDEWEVELSEGIVVALDKINCPWKHDGRGKQRGYNRYWRADTHLYSRLWGWARYHRRGKDVDNGAWIKKSQIAKINAVVKMTDAQWEQAIIGFKKGPGAKPIHSRFPVHANKWWAMIFGFYYSSGSRNMRLRKGKYVEDLMRIRAHDDVIPMVMQAARAVGAEPIISGYIPVYDKPHANGLGTTCLPTIRLSSSIMIVMEKFGMPIAWQTDERLGKGSRGRTSSSNIEPFIPDWIKEDHTRMHGFVEAFINGSKGQSILARTKLKPTDPRKRPWLNLHILLRMSGRPKEWIRRFLRDIGDWMEVFGVDVYFRELKYYSQRVETEDIGTWKYELAIHGMKGWKWFLDTFEIRRPDLRARVYARVESMTNQTLYECLLSVGSPENVILGRLYEQTMTKAELITCFQMREVGIVKSLQNLQKRGMITRRGDHYYYDPEEFTKRFIKENKALSEQLTNRMARWADKLLYQCPECHRVYIKPRMKCGLCGGEVGPVARSEVLKRMDGKRRLAKLVAYKVMTKDTEGLEWDQ